MKSKGFNFCMHKLIRTKSDLFSLLLLIFEISYFNHKNVLRKSFYFIVSKPDAHTDALNFITIDTVLFTFARN